MSQYNLPDLNSLVEDQIFHTINLNIWGIAVKESQTRVLTNGIINYPEINLLLPTCVYNGKYAVARKIPTVPSNDTPYKFENGIITYHGKRVFDENHIPVIPLQNGNPRNFKGYSLSFEGTESPFVELRINPKNTGNCPGRCLFCHRIYSYREKPKFTQSYYTPTEIINSIIKDYGENTIRKISHVSIITELYGNENKFIEFISQIKKELEKFRNDYFESFGACSQDVRTLKGMQKLYEIINPKKYSFTLETFTRREEIMGRYKGISMLEVKRILKNARKIGFKEIKINYVCGIDSYYDFEKNLTDLKELDLIDSIGISIFTAFFSDQLNLRHSEAYNIDYYLKIVKLIKKLGIKFYKPNCYEMGIPLKFLEY